MPALEATTTGGGRTRIEMSAARILREGLRGEAILAGDPTYDQRRAVWNGMVDHRPAIIVRCAEAGDVVRAVTFAREHDLLVSVRGGGHNIAGKAICRGGLMIDLSPLRAVTVDSLRRRARVQGGAQLGDLDAATQRHGLATTAGVVTHTGVGGLTLGGGVGRLARRFGLACDNLLSVDLVTADGEQLTASPTAHPDLFWGLRGAGANFGVATAFEFRLHPLGPTVLGGIVVHPLGRASEALRFYADYSGAAPDELSADAFFLRSPDGEPVFAISACWAGPSDEGERILAPLRRFGPPVADQIGPVAYTALQSEADAFFPPGLRYHWKSHFLDGIGDDIVEAAVAQCSTAPSPKSLVVFQQFGGAVARVAPDGTAFRHRGARYDHFPVAVWEEPAESERNRAWVRDWWEATAPWSMGAEYVNNLGDEGADRVRAAYGANYDRLVELKDKYDPTNFFRLNANIPPGGLPVSAPHPDPDPPEAGRGR